MIINIFRNFICLAAYVNSGITFPEPLSQEEEKKYLKLLADGDENAKNVLIEHNLRLVAHIAKKYNTKDKDNDDFISIGSIGLIKAVSTFDATKNNSLATYAARCIENEIRMSLRYDKKLQNETSLDEKVSTDKDGNSLTVADILGSDADMVENIVDSKIEQEKLKNIISKILTSKEQKIIELRYGMLYGYCMPQREVAELLGISRSYVSRIEKKAIEKLQKYFLKK